MKSDNLRFPTTERAEIGMDMFLMNRPASRSGEKWTVDDEEKLRRYASLGMTTPEVGERLGRTGAAVRKHAEERGIKWINTWTRWPKMAESRLVMLISWGWSARQIARDLKTTKNAVIGKARRMKIKWPERPETKKRLEVVPQTVPEMLLEDGEKIRPCLMCGDEFISESAGNRVCKSCKSTEAWKSGSATDLNVHEFRKSQGAQ